MPHPAHRLVLLAALAASAAGLSGCARSDWAWTAPASPSNDLRPGYNAFAPMAIRVYPLTHLSTDADGRPSLICHIELRDRWGDPVKALGRLQVQLYRPLGGLDADSAEQILKWDVALQDERQNAALYDPATQTYRLTLGGLPQWIADRVEPVEGRAEIRLEIRAVFQTLGPNGEEKVLRDAWTLGI